MDDDTLEQQLTQEWKDEDLSELIDKEEKVRRSLTVCLTVCLIVRLTDCMYVCLSDCLTVSVSLSVDSSCGLNKCSASSSRGSSNSNSSSVFISLHIYSGEVLSVCVSACLSACMDVYLLVRMPVYLSVCLLNLYIINPLTPLLMCLQDEEEDEEDMEMRIREEYHSDEVWEEIDVDSLDEGLDIIEVYDEDGELVGTYTGAEFDKLKRNK